MSLRLRLLRLLNTLLLLMFMPMFYDVLVVCGCSLWLLMLFWPLSTLLLLLWVVFANVIVEVAVYATALLTFAVDVAVHVASDGVVDCVVRVVRVCVDVVGAACVTAGAVVDFAVAVYVDMYCLRVLMLLFWY